MNFKLYLKDSLSFMQSNWIETPNMQLNFEEEVYLDQMW